MPTFHRGYGLKGAGLLLFIGAVASALFLGPVLREAPPAEHGPDVPAMSNAPGAGSPALRIE